jgi:WD40 repeat protein
VPVPESIQRQESVGQSQRSAWSPDKRYLAVGRSTGETAIWDLAPERAITKFDLAKNFSGKSVAWSPDNQQLAVAGARLVVLNLQSGRSSTPGDVDGPFTATAWSGDGRYLAAVTEKGVVKVWQTQTWREVAALAGLPSLKDAQARSGFRKDVWTLYSMVPQMTWTPDSRFLAAALNTQMLLIWEADSWREAFRVSFEHTYGAQLHGWTRNGHEPLFPGLDGKLSTWDPTNRVKALRHVPHPTKKGILIPDGIQQALAFERKEITIQDTISSPPREITLRGHGDQVQALAWSPDRSRLASASADHTLKVWDIRSGQELLSFAGDFSSVAWSPDGRRLAACQGSIVQIWDGSPAGR